MTNTTKGDAERAAHAALATVADAVAWSGIGYSGFFGTELDIILREWGIDTVIVSARE
jgi:nicotinamidase-related amidase